MKRARQPPRTMTSSTSSALYPQGNGRAELAVKSAKRILRENITPTGSLNTDQACRALLQYRNTPIQHIGLSPAQILFHRNLRDSIPVDPMKLRPNKYWITAAATRETAFKKRNEDMASRYNRTTRILLPLHTGVDVLVQDPTNKKRWNRSGTIVEVDGRKYTIKMHGSGRIVTRNRKFIKPFPGDIDIPLYSDSSTSNESLNSSEPLASGEIPDISEEIPPTVPEIPSEEANHSNRVVAIPRMRSRLYPHNKPGKKE